MKDEPYNAGCFIVLSNCSNRLFKVFTFKQTPFLKLLSNSVSLTCKTVNISEERKPSCCPMHELPDSRRTIVQDHR